MNSLRKTSSSLVLELKYRINIYMSYDNLGLNSILKDI